MSLELTLILLSKKFPVISEVKNLVWDEIAILLLEIGELEYQAAIKAFRESKVSRTPEREIEMGITCLRLAKEKFDSLAQKKSFKEGLATAFSMGAYKPNYLKASERSIEVSLLLAFCYKNLGDINLTKHYLEEVLKSNAIYGKKYAEYRIDATMGPWLKTRSDERDLEIKTNVKKSNQMIEELCKKIEEL